MQRRNPFPHQLRAANYIAEHRRCGLWMEPRTGKTLSAIYGVRLAGARTLLVVAPPSIHGQWYRECALEGYHLRIHGDRKTKAEPHGLIVSYVTTLFKGLKRKIARDTTAGMEKIKVGKDPISFSLYQFLCASLLKQKCKDALFTRTFLIICWNLMCRASKAFQIQFAHMEWKEGAFRIFFAHMKNDQCGERPRDPRHIYANPVLPEVCPILALV